MALSGLWAGHMLERLCQDNRHAPEKGLTAEAEADVASGFEATLPPVSGVVTLVTAHKPLLCGS